MYPLVVARNAGFVGSSHGEAMARTRGSESRLEIMVGKPCREASCLESPAVLCSIELSKDRSTSASGGRDVVPMGSWKEMEPAPRVPEDKGV